MLDDIVDQDKLPLSDSDDDCDVQTVNGESDISSYPLCLRVKKRGDCLVKMLSQTQPLQSRERKLMRGWIVTVGMWIAKAWC